MNQLHRYARQVLLPQIGDAGQAKLARARVMLVGCGALGGVIAEQLARAGVGYLRVVDRDVVELSNLQRQVLFDESDAREGAPKAIVAARRLRAVNSDVEIDPRVLDVHRENIEQLIHVGAEKVDLLLDGTDNVATRYLINDVAVKHDVPWVYGGCVGIDGRVMSIRPGTTACLRCVFQQPPAIGELPTCDTAGVLGPVAAIVASLQVIAAMQMLIDPTRGGELIRIVGWDVRVHRTDTASARRDDCPTCAGRRFEFLDASGGGDNGAQLCGRDAVQVRPPRGTRVALDQLATTLAPLADVERTPYLLRFTPRDDRAIRMTIFEDGRAIVHGTTDVARARSLYARFVGT